MDQPLTIRGRDEVVDLRHDDDTSSTDALTGLADRATIVAEIGYRLHALPRAHRIAVLVLDIDDFLSVSYTVGPVESDALLVELADRLRRVAGDRPLARIDGDVFALAVPTPTDIDRLVRDVRSALDRPFTVRDHRLYLTVASGAAYGTSGDDPATLLAEAGTASIAAAKQGRGGWAVFQPALRRAAIARLDAEQELNRAFRDEDLTVRFQPKIDLTSGEICGAEALLRWEKDGRAVQAPPAFINVAEGSGLIVPIGLWVMRVAFGALAEWQEVAGDRPMHISINLSGHQLAQPSLVDDLWAAMLMTGVDPAQVQVEITETVLLHDLDTTTASLSRLRAMGVRVAVDDFGTGYASLNYLRRFPVDILKIDKEFVSGIGHRQQDEVIVEAVIRLAHDLGLQVVAEGVESQEQLDRVRELGCQQAQGYLLAPALDGSRMLELLGERPTW